MNILFGISGSVSAFKTISLIRLFIKDGHSCNAIITNGGLSFIKPELLVALGCKTYTDHNLDMSDYTHAMSHISLSRWADKILVIPASANIIAKISNGLADDLLSQTLLACEDLSKISIAPAMNVNMLNNPFTQYNLKKLRNVGYKIIESESGLQACGDIGSGRLSEPEDLYKIFKLEQNFLCMKVLITVGATVEDIDGVRYLSNYSSGKMGLSLIKELLIRGAAVTVLKAKVSIDFSIVSSKLNIIDTLSAIDMNKAMLEHAPNSDIFIACAAVADYRIKEKFEHKIKKTDETISLEFVKNPDVLKTCKEAYPNIFAVGFAAESQNLKQYALAKLKSKNLDMIIANDISVLSKDYTSVIILSKSGNELCLNNISKQEVAKNILDEIKNHKI